jgi:hypothetical protein
LPHLPQRQGQPSIQLRLYRERNRVGRFFKRRKHYRPVATRYDKLAVNFLAMINLADIRLWLRATKPANESTPWTRARRGFRQAKKPLVDNVAPFPSE